LPLLPSSWPATRLGMSGEVEVRSFPAATPFVGLRAEGLLGATSPVLVLVLFRLGDLRPDSAYSARNHHVHTRPYSQHHHQMCANRISRQDKNGNARHEHSNHKNLIMR